MKLLTRLLTAIASLICCSIIIFSPLALVSRGITIAEIYPQEKIFFITSLLIAFLGGLLGFGLHTGIKEKPGQRKLVWWSAVVMFLYISCCLLCQRLDVGTFTGRIWCNIGVGIFLAGAFFRLWAIATLRSLHSGFVAIQKDHPLIESGPYRFLCHPSYFGVLLIFSGIPLIFNAWFPLLAVPGVFVTIRWRINSEEALLTEHFGENYSKFKQSKWRLIPFLY